MAIQQAGHIFMQEAASQVLVDIQARKEPARMTSGRQ